MADGCRGKARRELHPWSDDVDAPAAHSAWLIGYTEEAMRILVSRRILQLDCSGTRAVSNGHCTERSIKYAEDCILLNEWIVIAVHKIPSIWKFMSTCIKSGKLFGEWKREHLQNKKSIVMRSLGIGKSTLLWCTDVCPQLSQLFYLGLFYLSYEDSKVVQFAVPRCKALKDIHIYEEFIPQQDISTKLLLDEFQYRDIYADVQDAGNIAGVDLKFSKESMGTAVCCHVYQRRIFS
ncbi:hypothetical protein KXD40_002208 [Peronospora effusa]|nr:hypothetical protein KXD40_002208 [Peronospora effusa]